MRPWMGSKMVKRHLNFNWNLRPFSWSLVKEKSPNHKSPSHIAPLDSIQQLDGGWGNWGKAEGPYSITWAKHLMEVFQYVFNLSMRLQRVLIMILFGPSGLEWAHKGFKWLQATSLLRQDKQSTPQDNAVIHLLLCTYSNLDRHCLIHWLQWWFKHHPASSTGRGPPT